MFTRNNLSEDKPSLTAFTTAIIGGGKISEQHLSALNNIGGVSVAAVSDLSPALAQYTAERFHIKNYYTNYHEMLKNHKIDIIHVLTPPATHDRIVRDCLESGSHVIVEKPIALSNQNFRDLFNLAASRKLMLIENHNYRFNTPILQLSDAINAGRIGEINEVEVRLTLNIRDGGRYADTNLAHPSHQLPAGIIHEFITHISYLLLHFIPEGNINNPKIVRAFWRNDGGGSLFKYDNLDALIIYNGIHARIRFSCNQWPDIFSIQVHGTGGMAIAELYQPVCLVINKKRCSPQLMPILNSIHTGRTIRRAGFNSLWGKIRNRSAYEGLARFLDLTYKSIQNGVEPPVNFQQMDNASHLIDDLLDQENRL